MEINNFEYRIYSLYHKAYLKFGVIFTPNPKYNGVMTIVKDAESATVFDSEENLWKFYNSTPVSNFLGKTSLQVRKDTPILFLKYNYLSEN